MKTHLVIGDSHSQPDVSNERYDWLGEFIIDLMPDVIVDLGDWASMDSLCSYEKGTKGFEGKRLANDFAAARDARKRANAPTARYNQKLAKSKKKQYKPRKIACLGNHEYRIQRMLSMQPEYEGTYGIEDLGYEDFGWEVYPFKQPVKVDGINYCHYFTSGAKGYPIGGDNAARRIMHKLKQSGTAGHSHFYNHFPEPDADGSFLHGHVAGCYFDHWMDYAGPDNHKFRRGLLVKRNVDGKGDYDHEWVSLDEIRRRYG